MLDAHLHHNLSLPNMKMAFICSVDLLDAKKMVLQKQKLLDLGYRIFVGIHPLGLRELSKEEIKENVLEIEKLLSCVFGLGEIGLDKRKPVLNKVSLEDQLWAFDLQLQLAYNNDCYVNLHCIRAERLIFERLNGFSKVIIHSFSGSLFYLEKFVQNHWYISFSPSVLRSSKYTALIAACPLENILVETDFPFQTDNFDILESLFDNVSSIKKITVDELKSVVYENMSKIVSNNFIIR